MDLAAIVCLFAELDADVDDARERLESTLGPATMIIASGGVWSDPFGADQDKLHLYWRLDRPCTSLADIDRVWALTAKIKRLADAGDESPQPVHPMRCAGSAHTKTATGRLCRIVGASDAEITLDSAEASLSGVTGPVMGFRHGINGGTSP